MSLAASRVAANAETLDDTYGRLRSSLALVVARTGGSVFTGTGFCVATVGNSSYFVTSRHVVDGSDSVKLIPDNKPDSTFTAKVVRVGDYPIDVALLKVDGHVSPPLRIANDSVREGDPIAVAGYPKAQVEFAAAGLGLTPSVHEGIISALVANGLFLELDAQVDHGNSGGPAFDPATGIVYGIVTMKIGNDQTNLALSVSRITSFMRNARVPYALATKRDADQTRGLVAAMPASSSTATRRMTVERRLAKMVFPTYTPLIDGEVSNFACNSGVSGRGSVSFYRQDQFVITYALTGRTEESWQDLEGHDSSKNLVLYGYFKAGEVTAMSPQVTVPLVPSSGWTANYVTVDGRQVVRRWIGSSHLTVPAGTFPVEVYEDLSGDSVLQQVAFANNVGAVGFVLLRDNQPFIECGLVRRP